MSWDTAQNVVQQKLAALLTIGQNNVGVHNDSTSTYAVNFEGDFIGFNVPSPSTIHLTSGTLKISQSITIAGPGPSALTIAGDGTFGIFSFDLSIVDSLSGLTVTVRSGLT